MIGDLVFVSLYAPSCLAVYTPLPNLTIVIPSDIAPRSLEIKNFHMAAYFQFKCFPLHFLICGMKKELYAMIILEWPFSHTKNKCLAALLLIVLEEQTELLCVGHNLW